MLVKNITISLATWQDIHKKFIQEYHTNDHMLSGNIQKVLGFNIRIYKEWEPNMVHFNEYIVLEFDNNKQKSIFLLKYSDILNRKMVDLS